MNVRNRNLWYLSLSLILTAAAVRTRLHLSRRKLRRKGQRRWWVRPVNRSRRDDGFYHNLFSQLKETDHEEFFRFTRMVPAKFNQLLELVSPFLVKRSIRKPLATELRLALTLSYLAHGDSVSSKSWEFRIGLSTSYKVIPEVCRAIWNALQPTYLPPMSKDKWTTVAEVFQEKWQFPNCLGAVDGKQIKIKAPFRSGTNYFCYKKYYSLVLMGICDAKYCFTWVDIGQYGSLSDCSIWTNSDFAKMLEHGEADLPPEKCLPESNIKTPFTFVGDEAFPLKLYMMRPYSRKDLGDAERIFNYRLSRARRVIENAFGILVSRWQIFLKTICASPKSATSFVMATVCLHNFLMQHDDHNTNYDSERYCPPDLADREDEEHNVVEGDWRDDTGNGQLVDITRLGTNNAARNANHLRDTLRDYFISEPGENQAPWQYRLAFRGLAINIPQQN